MADNLIVIGSIVTVVVTILGSAIAISKIPAERRKMDADAMASYASAVASYGDEVRDLRIEIDRLRRELGTKITELEAAKTALNEAVAEIEDLREWSLELVEQLRGAKIEPAPFKRRPFK